MYEKKFCDFPMTVKLIVSFKASLFLQNNLQLFSYRYAKFLRKDYHMLIRKQPVSALNSLKLHHSSSKKETQEIQIYFIGDC